MDSCSVIVRLRTDQRLPMLRRDRGALIVWAAAFGILALNAAPANAQSLQQLQEMSIEQLANIDITSVSKTAQPLNDAPAAIYVITHDDIIRSGAVTLPEILRLAPNLQVAEINAGNYAITARGFNSADAGKLLVMIDGRSVYTPFFSGVYWDRQDVPPEDIERIEVVSGPGGTLWGANAVNGVINIITRKSSDTQGGLLELGGGNLERKAMLQYGGKIGSSLSYRLYVGGIYHDNEKTASGKSARDSYYQPQGGFRVDWTPDADTVTLQGDLYKGYEDQLIDNLLPVPALAISGQNLLARWTHEMAGGSEFQIQTYYDYLAQSVPGRLADYLHTYDLDVQHSFKLGSRQQIVWGGGYRITKDNFPTVISSTQLAYFSPQMATLGQGNGFVQDTLSVAKNVKLVLGTRIEFDPYSRPEILPNIRLSWSLNDTNLVWAAVSRAVRAPSRLDRDAFEVISPSSPILTLAGADFQPEKLVAYELGYRSQPTSSVSFSVSAFYNDYQNLRSADITPSGPFSPFPIVFGNDMRGDTYGIEFWGNYRVTRWWRLTPGVNWLHKNLSFKPGSNAIPITDIAGNDPAYQFSLRSSMDLGHDVTLDLDLRNIASLPSPVSPSYVDLNGRIGWAITRSLDVSLTGDNLLNRHHLEFGSTDANLQVNAVGVETGRSFYFDVVRRF